MYVWFHLLCMNKHSQAVEVEKIIREILYPGKSPFFELSPDGECKSKCVYMCVCLHVSPLQPYVNVCARLQLMNPFLKAVSLLLCLPCRYNYKGHFNLKPSQFEFPLNIWPIFLLWLHDWMRPHRFLLTSGPIWNLVPLSSAQNERIHTHTHTCKYTTHTCA